MAKSLVVIDGTDQGQTFPLTEGSQVIGNSRKHCTIFLHDLLMARAHCQIDVAGDQITVRDIERSTGTIVNGQKITVRELHAGDVIRVGNTCLRLQSDDHPEGGRPAEARSDQPAGDRLEDLVDHTLGHFKLESVLGRGHCGVVFRAQDLKSAQKVALKVLQPSFPKNDAEMQRFIRVMRTMMPVRHPHIVSLLGAGKTSKYCWLSLEYVEGESVSQILVRTNPDRKIEWQRGYRVALHMARALDRIHQHYQFHGNITPNNILVQSSDHLARLSDLMLGNAIESSHLQLATLESKFLAELPYRAPEQVREQPSVDRLSDIYSLGVVTYALLTGRQPFVGESTEETIARIQEGAPTPPRKHQKEIPEALERMVLRMLAKQQENRYPTASELHADLQRIEL